MGGQHSLSSYTLTVNVAQPRFTISPNLYGAFFEEISQGGEGGIYGEMVRNRGFNESTNLPVNWSLVTSSGATGFIANVRDENAPSQPP
jgi:hypothetical protein